MKKTILFVLILLAILSLARVRVADNYPAKDPTVPCRICSDTIPPVCKPCLAVGRIPTGTPPVYPTPVK